MGKVADYEKGGAQKEYYSEEDVIRRSCPLCGGGDYSGIYKERGAIGVVRCKKCGLIYVNPMVKEPEKNYWGDEKKYYEEARLIFDGKAKSHRDSNYLDDLRLIEKMKPYGNFLDIGTNAGFFLRHARAKKWNVFGIEPSPSLSDMARRYFGLNVRTAYLENAGFEDNFFDIVTMTDVFEHVADPKKILGDIKRVLKKDGILFIKVPNGKYSLLKFWIAKKFNKLRGYDIFDSYEHLAYYTQKTLTKILENNGFRVRKIFIGKPIQLPVWHRYVGHFYEYPSPWTLDIKDHMLRIIFYWAAKIEFLFKFGNIGYFAPNIIVIAQKTHED